ncbi:MAG: tetratricopeptide repeat protein [Bacteroidota bacterium]
MSRLFYLITLLLLSSSAYSKHFEFDSSARDVYQKVLSLRFNEAYALLAHQKLKDPDNLVLIHIENYIDFFTIYISEDKAVYDRLRKHKKKRLARIKEGDPSSPYYLYAQADIRLQWALVQLKFEDYLSAFNDVSKAYKLLQRNQEQFPDFMPNLKDLGILHAMVGTIPDNYKWGARLLGLSGTIEQGQAEIQQVLDYAATNDFIFETETHVLHAYFLLHLKHDYKGAWQAVKKGRLSPTTNPLHAFIMANIAMRTGKNDEAIRILQQAPKTRQYVAFPYLEFMLGMAKLRRMDEDADQYFTAFLKKFRGRNFIKETYQKLAWHKLIAGDREGYRRYMKACLDHGDTESGEDKNAYLEAQAGTVPIAGLIKARLLFDGGYYQRALTALEEVQKSDLKRSPNQLEYTYRMGRVLHGLQRYEDAISAYRSTITRGRKAPYFFACNAALQMGLIYEEQGNVALAKAAFQDCLRIKPDEYRTGLHQKAKSGLARLE